MNKIKHILIYCIILVLSPASKEAIAAGDILEPCKEHFPGGVTASAPHVNQQETRGLIQICKRHGDQSFFALEYSEEKLAPLWVAYKLEDRFGEERCSSAPREAMQCYFKADNIQQCLSDKKGADPFHVDQTLEAKGKELLKTTAFGSTGHDRGHMAPNNAFSWNICGTYQTFSMANMAAQIAYINRTPWQQMEAQVLYWAVEHGPIYVVTGPIWSAFPLDKLELGDTRVFKTKITKPNTRLRTLAGNLTRDPIPAPTGFYTIIYKPASEDAPARAAAFLMPQTKQDGLSFWPFLTSVSVVEEAADITFGFDDELKSSVDRDYWLGMEAPSGWSVRAKSEDCADGFVPTNWNPSLSVKQRAAACQPPSD